MQFWIEIKRHGFFGADADASAIKKFFGWGMRIFCEWSSFRVILAHVARPRAQPLGQSVSLKFSLETRLESESWAFDQLSSVSGSKVMI